MSERFFEIDEKTYGRISDLGELIHIARQIGKIFFRVDRVTVSPEVTRTKEGYRVKISPDHNGHETKGEKERAKPKETTT